MTHKHTEPHPSPSQSPSLTSSAPSCEFPPPCLRLGLRRAARGSCSSSGACRIARSYPTRAQTASPHSSRICTGEETTKQKVPSSRVGFFQWWSSQAGLKVSCEHVWAYVAAEYSFPYSTANLCFFLMPVSYHQAQWVIMGHMNISSKCSKMAGIMIGMSIRLPPTLRQEEISLTPHQWSVCLHWKNICFIVISTDLSNFATLHDMIKSSSVFYSAVYRYKNGLSLM